MAINVLVFPCGSENGLEIHASLKNVVNINLYGASGKNDHGRFVFKNYIGNLPYITDDKFISEFNLILKEFKIDVIIPTHDDISLFLAQHKNVIESRIAVPGLKQAIISRSKIKTYELFKNEWFCPKVFHSLDSIKEFPVFAKPDSGQGGKGSSLVTDRNDSFLKMAFEKKYVVTEYLPGDEFSVDCFSDRHGYLRFIGPRKRNRIFGGISVNSYTVPISEEFKEIANKINDKVKMRGLWYFQVKTDSFGVFKLLEISVRTSGTMNLYRGLGVNFPLLTVYDLMDLDVEIIPNEYYLEVDRALFNRYRSSLEYDSIYIDFDDTIIHNGKVNPTVIQFLYNAKNGNKKINLITKHDLDLDLTLDNLSIHKKLFTRIIHLKPDDEKYKSISTEGNAIFIDNSYKERVQVKRKLDIPVFDVDAIGTLINWKE